uniref:Uncharacterized protein n=1 Tax=Anopheles darlingi TaxID=43151 RepID=A0A2M4D773_ANODA
MMMTHFLYQTTPVTAWSGGLVVVNAAAIEAPTLKAPFTATIACGCVCALVCVCVYVMKLISIKPTSRRRRRRSNVGGSDIVLCPEKQQQQRSCHSSLRSQRRHTSI